MSHFLPKLADLERDLARDLFDLKKIALDGKEGQEPSAPSWLYRWNHTYLSPLAMAEFPPRGNLPTLRWGLKVAERLIAVLANSIAFDASTDDHSEIKAKLRDLKDQVARRDLDFSTLRAVVSDVTEFGRVIKESGERPQSMEDYAEIFQLIGLPAVASDYNQDATFAAMRTAGPNPMSIARLDRPLSNFPVSEAEYQQVMPGDTMERAMKDNRLYVCDYQALSVLEQNTEQQPLKYLYAPIALFAEHPTTRQLVPIAIQTQQTPGPDNPIVIADGSYDWLIAKSIVEMADGNYHELVSHLGRTHLYVEPFVVATGRNLPLDHPVAKLLWPHFEGTLFINFAALFTLINEGGPVDKLLSGTIESDLKVTANGVTGYPFNDAFLPKNFADRGVDTLKHYAYRDDALLYWKAIHGWVSGYLEKTYNPPGGLAGDANLQEWYRDLVSENGGRVKGFGLNGGFDDRNYLIDTLTLLIFTSSVQHAAVNFPQFDLMSYCPNVPLAAFSQFPGCDADAQDYLNILPPIDRSRLQLQVLYLLGTVHYTEIGQYADGYFDADVASGPLKRFQRSIGEIGSTIQNRNINRRPYQTLMPQAIPQSINI